MMKRNAFGYAVGGGMVSAALIMLVALIVSRSANEEPEMVMFNTHLVNMGIGGPPLTCLVHPNGVSCDWHNWQDMQTLHFRDQDKYNSNEF